jgi:hypothetical protein
MAGTGLARGAPRIARWAWSNVLPRVARFLPDTSTPTRSAEAAAWLLTDPAALAHNGEVIGFDRAPSRRVWSRARDPELARAALDQSLALLGVPATALRPA